MVCSIYDDFDDVDLFNNRYRMIKIPILILLIVFVKATDNGLGITPQMGWNSWNHFQCDINENLIKKTADLIVSKGLDQKGYQYVNLDDCWQVSTDLMLDC